MSPEDSAESESAIDRDRRRDVARDALDVGMRDPYWLHNLSRCLRHQEDAYADALDTVEQLREDADALEKAYEKMESDEWVPAEAALFMAERANFGDYDTHGHLYDNIPIRGREP